MKTIGYVPENIARRQRRGWQNVTITPARPAWVLGGSEFTVRVEGGFAHKGWRMECRALGVHDILLRNVQELHEAKVEALRVVERILILRNQAFASLVGNADDESGEPFTTKLASKSCRKSPSDSSSPTPESAPAAPTDSAGWGEITVAGQPRTSRCGPSP
jgi:hypothetical protein